MGKDSASNLFLNDGSFMEKFKQLHQEKQEKESQKEVSKCNVSSSSAPLRINSNNSFLTKRTSDVKPNDAKKASISASGSKFAFSLKHKSKVAVAPVKLGGDEDEFEDPENGSGEESAKRPKLGQVDAPGASSRRGEVAPPPPSDPAVRNVADKLASFVAKNGRQIEHVTRQRNPGDTPFKFLFDSRCADYKYYEYRILQEEKLLAQHKESQASRSGTSSISTPRTSNNTDRTLPQQSNYQTPTSALYDSNGESSGEVSGTSAADPIAMMEFYMKKAAQEERKRPLKQSKDEMPPPASLQASSKKGHHMGDFIPPEVLEQFMVSCNDASAQKAAQEAAEKAKIQADNVGHRLLSKMGWKEGEGLGSSRSGRADPVMAGNVKKNNLGVGAEQPGEVNPEDDIYEQYKKRMMLGYRYRPNPLNNPRKAYY